MQVSVIIPVYQVEKYIQQAVQSVLEQPEIGEVLLIEDGSSDGSLQACTELSQQYPQVKLFQHPNAENRGVSASRNLGIAQATCEYIAFLDADDLYLPGRFTHALAIMDNNPDIDGVYEAVGNYFQDESSREQWRAVGREESKLTTINEQVPPEQLFARLVSNESIGWFHANGLTVRKKIFEATGYFDQHLRFSEDVVMWLKMAASSTLLGGRLAEPVALRRVHGQNSVIVHAKELDYYNNLPRWQTLFKWAYTQRIRPDLTNIILRKYIFVLLQTSNCQFKKPIKRKLEKIASLALLVLEYPAILRFPVFWNAIGF